MIYALWDGGGSYACPNILTDIEEFPSIEHAKGAFWRRYRGGDRFYPCVDRECQMQIFLANPAGDRDPYPDFILQIDGNENVIQKMC